MKIHKFKSFLNEMKKSYGDDFSLKDIKPGQEVIYQGTKYYVITSNEVVLELNKNKDAKTLGEGYFYVNRNMFKTHGAIKN